MTRQKIALEKILETIRFLKYKYPELEINFSVKLKPKEEK